ncbi:chemotaxis response regulator protein-glutamate methylesterase [Leptospira langatensis]|uniref:Protein-glutamate methylesterase/protein-glutamine glutaminase n=1 Tax=Leptospira langatensis TaxID=2484983 RepID=A0A5F1ZYA1_9LEPT|nr:chemotaxis response regulator protein-glutamate methylesterase [Leptospira langatensis]TGK00078.1 chemotaxis response regulator protein-glutamate methylesterase [Leptospira langatensis]TGL42712.1 chemotaxis response regulator protein-glutamate methylesterase [Leptospira langatensis]
MVGTHTDQAIRIVIIDDSLLVRNIISDQIQKDERIQVIATGKTGVDCIELATKLRPDLVVLDVEMPVLDGLSALQELQKRKMGIPVMMLSVLTQHGAEATFKALEYGAIDFVPKPSTSNQFNPEEIGTVLRNRILSYFESVRHTSPVLDARKFVEAVRHKIFKDEKKVVEAVCIGTSTGGPKALQTVFSDFPENFPLPIFVVQHMPVGFTKAFASRLNDHSKITVKEAEDGEEVRAGFGYVAPGDAHLKIESRAGRKWIALGREAPVNGHRPSVEVLFDSAIREYGSALVGVIMTGMGKDGAAATLRMREAGASTVAQDEESSVIFGMNRQAIEMGGVQFVEPVSAITSRILSILKERGN